MKRRAFLALLAAIPLAGCGFRLRGAYAIPYRSLYLDAPKGSQTAQQLANTLKSQGVHLAETAKEADATLKLAQETQSRSILSLSGGGRVREYRLNYSLSYSLTDRNGREIIPATTLQANRDFTYDDSQYLAKTAEESLLYRDLRDDAVQQILRRLATAR